MKKMIRRSYAIEFYLRPLLRQMRLLEERCGAYGGFVEPIYIKITKMGCGR